MSLPFKSDEATDAAIAWMAATHQLSARAVASAYGIASSTALKILRRADSRLFTGQRYVPVLSLSDLSEPRQWWVKRHDLRGYSNRCDFHGCEFDQAIARITLHPCPVPSRDRERLTTAFIAREDTNARYHLFDSKTKDFACALQHKDAPVQIPRPRHLDFQPEEIPENLRCSPNLLAWPPAEPMVHHTSAKLAPIYADLIETQGLACAICHNQVGTILDHDHSTKNVRGLLCTYCNRHVDECLHLAVCPHAEYLAAPPVSWQIRHPNHRTSRKDRRTR